MVEIRERTPGDLAACIDLAALVQLADGYPSFLGDGGFDAFVAPPDALGAWVATIDGKVAGHVMLRPRSAPPSVARASSVLGVGEERLGFVARLMVDPATRRLGIARRLLDTVVAAARRRGLVTVLDVVTSDTAAIALYDATGWTSLGDVSLTMRDGSDLELLVYAAP